MVYLLGTMKQELPNPFLRPVEMPQATTASSGIRQREAAPSELEPTEAYIAPSEANAFIARRTQDLDTKLRDASPEERALIQNELGSLRAFKRKIDQEVRKQGEDVLVENPYFGGEISFGEKEVTKQQAEKLLDLALNEQREAQMAREKIMRELRGYYGMNEQENAQPIPEAAKKEIESSLSERLHDALDRLDEMEDRVSRYEKLVSLIALREALLTRREAIMKELKQIDDLHERAARQAQELHQSAERKKSPAEIHRGNAFFKGVQSEIVGRPATPAEELASMNESIAEAYERDKLAERARRLRNIADTTAGYARKTGSDRAQTVSAYDEQMARVAEQRAEQAEADIERNDAKRRIALTRYPEAEKRVMHEQIRAERAEADKLESMGSMDQKIGDMALSLAEKQEKKAKARKKVLADSLSHVMDQIESVDEKLEDIGPITEKTSPKIKPHEKRGSHREPPKDIYRPNRVA